MYSKSQLESTYRTLAKSTYRGVEGVKIFKGKEPGPTIALTIFTHGNEPSGIAAYRRLLETNMPGRLRRGKFICTINNLAAAEKFFIAKTAEEESSCRFIDVNMNRLPQYVDEWEGDERYEIRRAKELLSIWQEFEIAMDVHSTIQESLPMFVLGDNVPNQYIKDMPIDVTLTNIHHVQIGLPAFGFYGNTSNPAKAFEIEAGQHTSHESFQRAALCVELFLQNTGAVVPHENFKRVPVNNELQIFDMVDTVVAPNNKYELTRSIPDFEFVSAGTVLAVGGGKPLKMPNDGHVIFGPPDTRIKHPNEEIFFVSKPVQRVTR